MNQGYEIYFIRTAPDIGLPCYAVVEDFVKPADVEAQIKAAHHNLRMMAEPQVPDGEALIAFEARAPK